MPVPPHRFLSLGVISPASPSVAGLLAENPATLKQFAMVVDRSDSGLYLVFLQEKPHLAIFVRPR
jgi:hypothetical protein